MATRFWTAVRATALAALAVLVLAAGACSSGGDKSRSDSTSNGGAAGPQSGGAPEPSAGDQDSQGKSNGVGTVAVRSIIFTGSVAVKVDDVTKAADQIKQKAEAAGGYIGSDQRSSSAATTATATIVVRVPSAEFGDTITAVSALGEELRREYSQDDVTAQVVDLDARIATQQAGIDRIRQLIKDAPSTADLLAIDQELTRREADLASLKAQRDKLNDLVSLSTLTVYLYGPDAATPKKDEKGFVAGLKKGWHAFVGSLEVLITVIGAVLPFAVTIGVLVWLILWLSKRRRANRPVVAPPIHPAYGTTGPIPPPAPPAAPRPTNTPE
jgi:hypothetical protein